MKVINTIFLILAVVISSISFGIAQQPDKRQQEEYLIVRPNNTAFSKKIRVTVFDNESVYSNDSTGVGLDFNNTSQMLNYFAKQGWIYVESIHLHHEEYWRRMYVFRRKILYSNGIEQ